jgi:glycosyltransferase involved in cell wall biosynthesis
MDALPRKVLVIAYYFPPMGLSGVQRTLKFVKYLPQFGWQPTVLTVTPTGYYAHDPSLLEELEGLNIGIVRVGSLDPNRMFKNKGTVKMPSERWRKVLTYLSDLFFIPDNKIGWKRKALKAIRDTFKNEHFDVVFATAPPFTDFLIGKELHEKFHAPLVLDYRDPWHEYPFKYYPTPWHRWRNYLLEKDALTASNKVITTNRRVKEMILKRYEFLKHDDISILPHGYDPQDFESVTVHRTDRRFRITHAGVFYGDRTPRYFLDALKKVVSESEEMKNSIEACFVGHFPREYEKYVRALKLEDNVALRGYLSHKDCVRELLSSDVLWGMIKNDSQSPGKFYEYIGARKPILACVPEGFVKQTVLETGAGTVTPPDDVDAIAEAIRNLYRLHKEKKLPVPDEEIVKRYDRKELTKELAHLLSFQIDITPQVEPEHAAPEQSPPEQSQLQIKA